MWDPNIGLGTVTHQNIGYLFPMGPFYWVTAPARRARVGRAAALARHRSCSSPRSGCCTCCARCTSAGPGALVGGARVHAHAVLARLRGAHLGDPAAVGRAAVAARVHDPRAARRRGWKYPALFALVVQVVGSVNATALVFAGIVPVLWVAVRGAGSRARSTGDARRASPWRRSRCSRCSRRCGGSPGCGSQGGVRPRHPAVHRDARDGRRTPSLPSEVLRGLGYWFFYGSDKHRPLDRAERRLHAGPLAASLVELRDPGARAARRRRSCGGATARSSCSLMLVGVVVAVGAHPYDDPSVARRPVQGVRGVVELRARAAQHRPRGAAGRARPRGAARRRRQRGRGAGRRGRRVPVVGARRRRRS